MNSNTEQNHSFFETTAAEEMTKTFSQLCNSMSSANVNIPRFDSFKDAYDFIGEFESVTTGMTDNQRASLISKAFPMGCFRPWFETTLKPLVDRQSTWSMLKTEIIKRFGDVGDHERHLRRLKALNYDPASGKSLLEFIEDFMFSYAKVYGDKDDEMAVKLINASLPMSIKPQLSIYTEYREAKNSKMLKNVAKQYDASHVEPQVKVTSREDTKHLAELMETIVKNFQKESEQTRRAVASVYKVQEDIKELVQKNQSNYYHRPSSPKIPMNSDQRYHNSQIDKNGSDYKRSQSPGYEREKEQRPRSPGRYQQEMSIQRPWSPGSRTQAMRSPIGQRKAYDRPPTPRYEVEKSSLPSEAHSAMNTEMYFARFGKPPSPCNNCKSWHWRDHCPFHLN